MPPHPPWLPLLPPQQAGGKPVGLLTTMTSQYTAKVKKLRRRLSGHLPAFHESDSNPALILWWCAGRASVEASYRRAGAGFFKRPSPAARLRERDDIRVAAHEAPAAVADPVLPPEDLPLPPTVTCRFIPSAGVAYLAVGGLTGQFSLLGRQAAGAPAPPPAEEHWNTTWCGGPRLQVESALGRAGTKASARAREVFHDKFLQ